MSKIPSDHPRAKSLHIREMLIDGFHLGIVTSAGLIAHGRGEAFDYILGEKTSKPALKAMEASGVMLLSARKAVISINGNVAALAADEIVRLSQVCKAKIEVNLFYRSFDRERAIAKLLKQAGAKEILGVGKNASARIPELSSERRRVDPEGILEADVVLVPLEDGDRTEGLIKLGKKVIAIDLNPLSRTALKATITIVDNVVRTLPKLIEMTEKLAKQSVKERQKTLAMFDNRKNLAESVSLIEKRLKKIATSRDMFSVEDEEYGL